MIITNRDQIEIPTENVGTMTLNCPRKGKIRVKTVIVRTDLWYYLPPIYKSVSISRAHTRDPFVVKVNTLVATRVMSRDK